MTSNEYTKAFMKSFDDLADRLQRRDLLNAEIAGLRETVRVLSNRVTLSDQERNAVARLLAMVDYATPNLTDSIRALLTKVHPKEFTAIEVRNALEDSAFNFDEFSNSLSACHAALKRLLADDKVEAGTMRDGKPTYKAVLPKLEPSGRSLLDVLAGTGGAVAPAFMLYGTSEGENSFLNHPSNSISKVARALDQKKNK
jgi:hypothetical protein